MSSDRSDNHDDSRPSDADTNRQDQRSAASGGRGKGLIAIAVAVVTAFAVAMATGAGNDAWALVKRIVTGSPTHTPGPVESTPTPSSAWSAPSFYGTIRIQYPRFGNTLSTGQSVYGAVTNWTAGFQVWLFVRPETSSVETAQGPCQVTGATWTCSDVKLPGSVGTREYLDVVVGSERMRRGIRVCRYCPWRQRTTPPRRTRGSGGYELTPVPAACPLASSSDHPLEVTVNRGAHLLCAPAINPNGKPPSPRSAGDRSWKADHF